MNKIKKIMKRENGFTLVEFIVVFVIFAIFTTMLLPSLTKYVDNANERALIAEARSAVVVAQTLVSERYAGISDKDPDSDDIEALAEISGEVTFTYSSDTEDGKVIKLIYINEGLTKKVTYEDSKYEVEDYVAVP